MKIKISLVGFLLLCSTILSASSIVADRVALIVENESTTPKIDDAILRTLIEAEFSQYWNGELLDRENINLLIDEYGLSDFSDTVGSNKIKIGQMLKAEYLLVLRIKDKSILSSLTTWPEMEVIKETQLDSEQDLESVAHKISRQSIIDIKAHKRDPSSISVTIGNFIAQDANRMFLEVNDLVHKGLREKLLELKSIFPLERMMPSALLSEKKLFESGLIKRLNYTKYSPLPDLMVFGDFKPSTEQTLNSKSIELIFNVHIFSPTSLIPIKDVSLKTTSEDMSFITKQIQQLIEETVIEIKSLAFKRDARLINSSDEFFTLKKQAMSLLPYKDIGPQVLPHDRDDQDKGKKQLLMALKAVENALLCNYDDADLRLAQIRLITGIVSLKGGLNFERNYKEGTENYIKYENLKQVMSVNLTLWKELYSSNKTRKIREAVNDFLFRKYLPDEYLKIHENYWNYRYANGISAQELLGSAFKISQQYPDFEDRFRVLLEGSDFSKEDKESLHTISAIFFNNIINGLVNIKAHEKNWIISKKFADKFIELKSPLFNAFGYFLHCQLLIDNPQEVSCFEQYFIGMCGAIKRYYEVIGKDIRNFYLFSQVPELIRKYEQILSKNSLDGIYLRYINVLLEIGNFNDAEGMLNHVENFLVETKQYKEIFEILKKFMTNYTVGQAGDFAWMKHMRIFNSILVHQEKIPIIDLKELKYVRVIEGEINGLPHTDRGIRRLVLTDNEILGFVGEYSFDKNHKAGLQGIFNYSIEKNICVFTKNMGSRITDLAVTNNHIAVSDYFDGLYVIDRQSPYNINLLASGNTSIPKGKIRSVVSDGSNFYIGLLDWKNLQQQIYKISPINNSISNLNMSFNNSLYIHIRWLDKYNDKINIYSEDFDNRYFKYQGKWVKFQSKRKWPLSIVEAKITDGDQVIFQYEGLNLNFVYQIAEWQGHLLFATAHGLYLGKVGGHEANLILAKDDLVIYSIIAHEQELYLGTNQGLYIMDGQTFRKFIQNK